ncbi:MAG: sugar phosphate isomerase/epimerase [Chthonomonadales bacterium]
MTSGTSPFNWVGTAFSVPHMFGWMPAQDGSQLSGGPLSNTAWMDWAAKNGLSGVEIPLPPDHADAEAMQALAVHAASLGLKIVLGAGPLSTEEITNCIKVARTFQPDGPITMRATLSKVLCGDRRLQEGGWQNRMNDCLSIAKELVPVLRDNNASVALENHQDATAVELRWLCQLSDQSVIGVTLDTGNPLAVGEDILEFTRQVAPFVRHVHCKDYTVHAAPNGFRLVRCAAGRGVVPFPELLAIIQKDCPNAITPGVENAAQAARLVPVFDAGWWTTYPAVDVRERLGFFQTIFTTAQPESSEWRTPWESGESSAAIVAHEVEEFDASCKYLTGITQADLDNTLNASPGGANSPLEKPVQILNM